MSLSRLTSSDAVLSAIAEADQLGEAAFRSKYGFGQSRTYFLTHEGKRYDSKAIVGAAMAHQFPGGPPLTARDFSGGERTVARKLSSLGFTVTSPPKARNPNWTIDELILALDLYLTFGLLDDLDPRVIEISDQLNRLPIHSSRPDAARFRNPNGVALKLANFASIDPAFHGRGMARGGALDQEAWDRYHNDRTTLTKLAGALRDGARGTFKLPAEPEPGEASSLEGRLLYRMHFVRERDSNLVARKKQQVLASGGRLACQVCGFDFELAFGPAGKGCIECHHVVPLADSGQRTTSLADLALLCSNCHRMLHRRQPGYSMPELMAMRNSSTRQP